MDSKKISIIVAVFVAVVAVMAYTYVTTDDGSSASKKTGDWYLVEASEVSIQDPTNPVFKTQHFSFKNQVDTFKIKSLEKHMFSASWHGVPVVGGIIGDYICFEVSDSQHGVYCYVEGAFKDHTLSFSVVNYSDPDLDNVIGGAHLRFVHECGGSIMSQSPAVNFESLDPVALSGAFYYIDDDDEIAMNQYTPMGFEFVAQSGYIAVIKTPVSHPDIGTGFPLYSVCIFKEESDGRTTYLLAGSSNGFVLSGGVGFADNTLSTMLNFHTTDGSIPIGYLCGTYAIDYPYGSNPEPTDISGTWKGKCWRSFGGSVIESNYDIEKEITFRGECFACVEEYTSEKVYTWIGSVYGNGIFALSEFNYDGETHYYYVLGHISGDSLHLCGYYLDE